MSWQDKTSGGYPVRITARDPGSRYSIVGEITLKGTETMSVRWTREGRYDPTEKSTFDLVPVEPTEDPGGDWEPTDEEFQYAQDLCRVPTIKVCDPLEIGAQYAQTDRDFRKFVDKAQAGELSVTCSFVWEGPESIKVKVGDRIQHPNGCCIDITETGFKVNATLDTVEFEK
jgi:hypothetical protein